MDVLKLWCAGLLCPFQNLKRFRFSCLYCRYRRRWYGKYSLPPYYIKFNYAWRTIRYALVYKGKIVGYKERWYDVLIDPQGHFTGFRCAAIVTFDQIIQRFRWTSKPLMEFIELLANYPTW